MRAIIALIWIVAAVLAVQFSALPAPVLIPLALVLIAAAALATVALVRDVHIVRLRDGRGAVYLVRAPDGTPVRVLNVGGVYQSATYLDERRMTPVFAYQRAFARALDLARANSTSGADGTTGTNAAAGASGGTGDVSGIPGATLQHALAIGGGGFAWPKRALTQHQDLALEVVEIDPAIIRVARSWFFLDELERKAAGRLTITAADGRAFLEGLGPAMRYDVIVNDTFTGREPVRALATVEAARLVRAHLAPGGVYAQNVVSAPGGDLTFLRDEVATLLAAFAHVYVVPMEDDAWAGEDNYLVLACDGDVPAPDAIPFDSSFPGTPLHDV